MLTQKPNRSIQYQQSHIIVCGGTENMSMVPMSMDGNKAQWSVPLGQGMQMYDSLWSGLTDSLSGTPMAITAENLAEQYQITRQDCDEYAILSQQRWKAAQDNKHFDLEMAPIEIKTKKGNQVNFISCHGTILVLFCFVLFQFDGKELKFIFHL